MTEQPTQQRTQGEIPEISAFRYTAASEKASLNPLNLNGLHFGSRRTTLSDRILNGIQVLVSLAPRSSAPEAIADPEPVSHEDLGVLRYQLPLSAYREQRRRTNAQARKVAVAGLVAISVPVLAFFGLRHLPKVSAPHAAPAPVVTQPAAPALETYTVQKGDTLSEIAHAHHVRVHALKLANGLDAEHRLKVGQVLKIPAKVAFQAPAVITTAAQLAAHEASGTALAAAHPAPAAQSAAAVTNPVVTQPAAPVKTALAKPTAKHEAKHEVPRRTKRIYYTIQDGDTFSEIAEKFGLKTGRIVEVNDLTRHTRLKVGHKLLIPPTEPVKTELAKHESKPKHEEIAEPKHRGYREHTRHKMASRGLLGDLGRVVAKHFLWPTMGQISSGFGHRSDHFHTGLDIRNHPGAPIVASKPGVVIKAGWDGDYGKMVDISHGNGIVTRYAHCSKLLVHEGQHVGQGQEIALVGETGRATGPHCHYEVRINGRPVDPRKFL